MFRLFNINTRRFVTEPRYQEWLIKPEAFAIYLNNLKNKLRFLKFLQSFWFYNFLYWQKENLNCYCELADINTYKR